MKVKEESEKVDLKLNIQKMKIMASGPITEESEKVDLKLNIQKNEDHGIWSHHFMANRWGNNGNSERLYFGGLQNHCRWCLRP